MNATLPTMRHRTGAGLGRRRFAPGWPLALLFALGAWLALGAAMSPWSADAIDWGVAAPSAPSFARGHWLGTDVLGRDGYARLVAGARLSLALALAAAVVSVLIGGLAGALAGLRGGLTDLLVMRGVDVVYALPQVFLIILLSVLLGRGPLAVLLGLASTGWLAVARVVRGEALLLRQREFIEAARAMGMGRWRLLWRHVVPNLLSPALWCLTIAVPQFVVLEGFVSFLGLGVQEPGASLGNLLAEAATHLERAPWMLAGPGVVLVLTVWCLHALGDAFQRSRAGHVS